MLVVEEEEEDGGEGGLKNGESNQLKLHDNVVMVHADSTDGSPMVVK